MICFFFEVLHDADFCVRFCAAQYHGERTCVVFHRVVHVADFVLEKEASI